MAAPMDATIPKEVGDRQTFCCVDATVATGFEEVAKEDAEEKLGATVTLKESKGKITINLPVDQVNKVLELGGIDNCSVLMTRVEEFGFTDDEREDMRRLRQLVGSVDWPLGLKVWGRVFTFNHPIADRPEHAITDFGEPHVGLPRPQKKEGSKRSRKRQNRKKNKEKNKSSQEENMKEETEVETQNASEEKIPELVSETSEIAPEIAPKLPKFEGTSEPHESSEVLDQMEKEKETRKTPWDPTKPSFRVTCNRTGDNHCFHSMTAASNFGGAVNDYFGWNVKMKDFDIEVILNIDDQEVSVYMGLTKGSLHRRNLNHFGHTTLRPTIAYNMLRLCDIKPGDVVCDPMCGSGSIPIQGALRWPEAHHIAGDISRKVMQKAWNNKQDQSTLRQQENKLPLPLDLFYWDTLQLPLQDNSVSVFVTDLPFGIRSGSKQNNWSLYPGALKEMARVCPPQTGRACLLTQDKKCMIKTLQSLSRYWHRHRTLGINIGGLAAGVYVLHRTIHPYCKTDAQSMGQDLEHDKTPIEEAL